MKPTELIIGFLLLIILMSCGTPFEPSMSVTRELTLTERVLVKSSNSFGLNLFREVNRDEEYKNVFISPLSVSMALGMAYNGAAGETKQQMAQVLGLEGLPLTEANESYRSLIYLLRDLDLRVIFQLANSIWYQEGFPFKEEFMHRNRVYFDAEVRGINFSDPNASRIINQWVKDKTRGRIEDIVPDNIDPEIVMYLINAIYFKGKWSNQFEKSKTYDAQFKRPDGTTKNVKMMIQENSFRFLSEPGLKGVELPYGDDYYVMTILLPDDGTDIEDFVASLSRERWNEILGKFSEGPDEMVVGLPRFKLEFEISLEDILKRMGMPIAFEPYEADFSEMFYRELISENLYISEVKHKTFVEVNEEGTEAAAATSVGMGAVSAPPAIIVNRPFVFAIRENHSGTILFMGKIVDPESK